jgi:glycerol-3-phosphate acyltransferase PlsX
LRGFSLTDFSYNFENGANKVSRPVTIAIDAMGGDHGIESAIPGAAIVLREQVVRFIIFGDETRITNALQSHPDLKNASTIVHTDKMVRNDEKPSVALRNGKDTSMRLAIEAVEQGHADAVVSSGNTGALMAMAKMILRPLPGIHRPALASTFPTMKGSVVMLDLGANVLVDAENLVQFAVMGATFARSYKAIHNPTVGLLNVGSEDMKGPDHVRAAAAILSRIEFSGRYHGFVEGDDITKGTVDVIVSDGYAGNIALKTGEGVGAMTGYFFKQAMTGDPLSILGGFLASFAIKRFKKRVDPRQYNGGVFLGLNGICVKSHGGADATGFSSAVTMAVRLARHGYTKQVSADIERLMGQDSFVTAEQA